MIIHFEPLKPFYTRVSVDPVIASFLGARKVWVHREFVPVCELFNVVLLSFHFFSITNELDNFAKVIAATPSRIWEIGAEF